MSMTANSRWCAFPPCAPSTSYVGTNTETCQDVTSSDWQMSLQVYALLLLVPCPVCIPNKYFRNVCKLTSHTYWQLVPWCHKHVILQIPAINIAGPKSIAANQLLIYDIAAITLSAINWSLQMFVKNNKQ